MDNNNGKEDEIVYQEYDHTAIVFKKSKWKGEIFQWIQSLVISVVLVALIVTFVGRVMTVKGESMIPTLHNNDKVLTTNIHKSLKHGDVVVIKRKNDDPLIKRVIAIEFQTVDINFQTGEVFVDGVLQDEPYIYETTKSEEGVKFPVSVPEGHVFVMGDNRNNSLDSRDPSVGMIDERNVFGKVLLRVFPFEDFGKLDK